MNSQLPPHNLNAEAGILGCMLCPDGNAYADAVAAGLRASWFYDQRHQLVFSAIAELEAAEKPPSVLLLKSTLGEDLDRIGGMPFLLALEDATPSVAILPHWLENARDAMLRRRMAAIASEALNKVETAGAGETLLKAVGDQCAAALDDTTARDACAGFDLGHLLIGELERRKGLHDSGQRSGICTGLRGLDKNLDGLQRGEQFVIGARPSQGKTALGLSIAAETAIGQGVPTLIVSLEMSVQSLLMRLCSICTEIRLSDLKRGTCNAGAMARIAAFNQRLAASPLFIFDGLRGLTGDQCAAVIRQHKRKHGVEVALIDYLQKLRPDRRNEKRTYEVGEVSGTLKAAAASNRVALVTLAQLNREAVKGADGPRKPRLHDLADSGQIERDADTVGLLHRDIKRGEDHAEIIIAKQRDGELGLVPLRFNGDLTRFENTTNEL